MKTAVITFGRFNPPHQGHELVFDTVYKVSRRNNADFLIFASHTQNSAKDPLPYKVKINFLQQMFPRYKRNIMQSNSRNIMDVCTELFTVGYKNLILVVGSDRVNEFDKLLSKYNGQKASHGFYNFETLKVVSAGSRDPDSDDVSGMSASKMRKYVIDNNKDEFIASLPRNFRGGESLWKELKKHMGIKESFSINESDEIVGDKAKESGIPYSILKQVYDRGMAAWKISHHPGTTPQQWAIARVNSFIKGGKTRQTADADLWDKRNESFEIGTDEIRQHTMSMTPGQEQEKPKVIKRFNDFMDQADEPDPEEIPGIDKGTVK